MNDNVTDLLSKIMTMVDQKVVEKKKRKSRTYTEEEKEVLRERAKKAREAKKMKREAKAEPSEEIKDDTETEKSKPALVIPHFKENDIDEVVKHDYVYDGFGESEY